MIEQKRYTAKEIERAISHLEKDENDTLLDVFVINNKPVELRTSDLVAMLNQVSYAEKENVRLKARLDAVVKNLEDMRKHCAFACVDTEDVDVILSVARGEGGAR